MRSNPCEIAESLNGEKWGQKGWKRFIIPFFLQKHQPKDPQPLHISDVVVGAPFEGDGCVYVFRGSAKGLEMTASQRICASDLISARPLKSFGYSLSGEIVWFNDNWPQKGHSVSCITILCSMLVNYQIRCHIRPHVKLVVSLVITLKMVI